MSDAPLPSPPEARPYRHNVGIALFNRDGRVLVARRLGDDGPEIILPGCEWQMPQGGIDPGEDPRRAARRELWEETGVTSATVLAEIDEWLAYDFPPYDGPPHRLAAFRGQRQRWYALLFEGSEQEIDVAASRNGAAPEFGAWRWQHLAAMPELVVPFKRPVYRRVAAEFAALARRLGAG
jgi:putative (di)nucleoside polyphosphate hydrolase